MQVEMNQWATICAPWKAIENSMRRGDVRATRRLLNDPCLVEVVMSRRENPGPFLASAESWLAEAETYEAQHGPGSRLDPNDPFNIEVARLRAVAKEQDTWRMQQRSAQSEITSAQGEA